MTPANCARDARNSHQSSPDLHLHVLLQQEEGHGAVGQHPFVKLADVARAELLLGATPQFHHTHGQARAKAPTLEKRIADTR